MEHLFSPKLLHAVHGLTHLFYLRQKLSPQVVPSVVELSQVTQLTATLHAVELQKAVIVPPIQLDLGIARLFNSHRANHSG